jgi:hypothetical protein
MNSANVYREFSLGVKPLGCQADNFSQATTGVTHAWNDASTLLHIFKAWCLISSMDSFTLTFTKFSDFAFGYFAVYVQRRLIFSRRFLFIVTTTCFGLTGHHQVYKSL